MNLGALYLVTQGHTHKQQPTSQTSKHSSQLSSPHHLSTHRLLPDVCLVPEEVCLHRTLSWNRSRLTSACMAIPHYSPRHTNERHTQDTIARELPRNCDAHITPKPLNMAPISLILRACTQLNPRAASKFTSRCCDEMMNIRRCLSVVTKDKCTHTAMLVEPVDSTPPALSSL